MGCNRTSEVGRRECNCRLALAEAAPTSGDTTGRSQGLRKVARNQTSIRVLIKNRFQLEGTERAAVLERDGRWLDDCTLSYLREQ